jgi:hypothetical protein
MLEKESGYDSQLETGNVRQLNGNDRKINDKKM